ncbi:outer membrane beta-barrel protein [Desulfobacterales bacterium HSG16]|nr:outer membrane beta-barrel protein [Desulfobacterales bacterium HSG16]
MHSYSGYFGRLVLLTICMFFLGLYPATAKEVVIRLGKLHVIPGLSYHGSYNDNIYSTEKDKVDDYIHTITPSLRFHYGRGILGLSGDTENVAGEVKAGTFRGGYGTGAGNDLTAGTRNRLFSSSYGGGTISSAVGSRGKFFTFGYDLELGAFQSNNQNNFQNHRFHIDSGIRMNKFYLKGNEMFAYRTDPYGSEDQYNTGIKTKRWENTMGLALGYKMTKLYSIELGYENFLRRYNQDIDKWQNQIANKYGLSLIKNVNSRFSVFAQYRRTFAEFDEQNDGISEWTDNTSGDYVLDDYFAGISFVPGSKLDGEIKLGYGTKSFDNNTDYFGRKYADTEDWIAETTVNYRPMRKTSLTCLLRRHFDISPDTDASSSVSTLFGLDLRQHLIRKIYLNSGFDWENLNYSNALPGAPEKSFNIYRASAGFDVRLKKWLTAGLEYEYRNKDASDDYYSDDEYDVSVLTFRSDIRF